MSESQTKIMTGAKESMLRRIANDEVEREKQIAEETEKAKKLWVALHDPEDPTPWPSEELGGSLKECIEKEYHDPETPYDEIPEEHKINLAFQILKIHEKSKEKQSDPLRYVIFFHDDADGWGSLGLALNALDDPKRNFLTKPVNYGQDFSKLVDTLLPTDHVFILDFSFTEEIHEAIYKKVEHLMILDHHESAEPILKDRPYAKYAHDQSGVLMTFCHFFDHILKNRDPHTDGYEFVPLPVRLLDNYDLWKKKDPKCDWSWVVGFHLYVKDHFGDYEFWRKLMGQEDIDQVTPLMVAKMKGFGDAIKEIENSADFTVEIIEGKKFLFYQCREDISLIADAFRDSAHKPDATISYFFREDDDSTRTIINLRGSDTQTVIELAKDNGGGGHRMAAGFNYPTDDSVPTMADLIDKIKVSMGKLFPLNKEDGDIKDKPL